MLYNSLDSSPVGPDHYTRLSPEPIDVIDAWDLSFNLASALKYIARAGHKAGNTEADDLRKAIWFLQRQIDKSKK